MRRGRARTPGAGKRADDCDEDGGLRIMHRLDGGSDLDEQEPAHLAGYRGARPVRTGNLAVDRALCLAAKRSLPAPFGRWPDKRNEIHGNIWAEFWNEECGHFVQTPGLREVDGALLLMPLVRLVTGNDPRWLATLDAIARDLTDDGWSFAARPAGRAMKKPSPPARSGMSSAWRVPDG